MNTGSSLFNFTMLYPDYFGGVAAFTPEQFKSINGFSNLYFGWGGEDDDLGRRVKARGWSISRSPSLIGR